MSNNGNNGNNGKFASLLAEYNMIAGEIYTGISTTANYERYADVLQSLAKAIAYSVLRKCINTSGNAMLIKIRQEITRDYHNLSKIAHCNTSARRLTYNADGDTVSAVVDSGCVKALDTMAAQSLGDGLDLVNTAIVAIMAETDKQLGRDGVVDLEKPYMIRRLRRKVWVQSSDSVNGWETVETTPIREIYKAVRRYITTTGAQAADPRNGYSYIEDIATDNETGEETAIYRRLAKYADLGGYACDYNGANTLYSVDRETIDRTESLISEMHLTKKQATVLSLRQSGYGYKAIATYLGVTQRAVAKTVEAIRKKAIAIGFTPNTPNA